MNITFEIYSWSLYSHLSRSRLNKVEVEFHPGPFSNICTTERMLIIRLKHRSTILTYTSEHLFSIWILLLRYMDNPSKGICPGRDEIKSRLSSILDHFPDIGRSTVERIPSKHRSTILTYTSEHLFSIWILLLRYIHGPCTAICLGWDEIRSRSRSSSILDHFLDVGGSH